jgi:hypothetical protein
MKIIKKIVNLILRKLGLKIIRLKHFDNMIKIEDNLSNLQFVSRLSEYEIDYSEINDLTLKYWFSSFTNAESQLREVIRNEPTASFFPDFLTVSQRLFGSDNPYSGMKFTIKNEYPTGTHISNDIMNILSQFIENASIGVEVGSFIGNSALLLGNFMKNRGGVLLCVDTFLGDINMWLKPQFQEIMDKSDGNPKIFDLFVDRIVSNNLTDTVLPVRLTSIIAARMFKVLNYQFDFVYLDSAHEALETFMELSLYWDLIAEGGVMFGDDYKWPAVNHDLKLFCNLLNLNYKLSEDGNTWIIKKTSKN